MKRRMRNDLAPAVGVAGSDSNKHEMTPTGEIHRNVVTRAQVGDG